MSAPESTGSGDGDIYIRAIREHAGGGRARAGRSAVIDQRVDLQLGGPEAAFLFRPIHNIWE